MPFNHALAIIISCRTLVGNSLNAVHLQAPLSLKDIGMPLATAQCRKAYAIAILVIIKLITVRIEEACCLKVVGAIHLN